MEALNTLIATGIYDLCVCLGFAALLWGVSEILAAIPDDSWPKNATRREDKPHE